MNRSPVTADCYLQVTNVVRNWRSSNGRVIKATTKRPEVTDPDVVVVKIRVQIPYEAFEPLKPEAVVVIPEELVQHPVTVEAAAP
jgi:hypothetical protein